jgi:signal transduction histidine kinase
VADQTSTEGVSFTTLLASTVHDMKNSLAVIINTIDELSEQQSPDPQRLKQLRYEGKRLNNEFIQMLSLYRIENGQYFANIDETSIYELLEEAWLENSDTLAVRNIELSLECDPDLMWFCDRALLLGVLNTTLNNAYKFARSRIRLSATVADHMLILNIDDDGPGYPAEMLISDSNHQKQIDFHSGSTGLGLYFATVTARLHHTKARQGHIALSNDGINGGGRFSLCLP